MQVAGDLLVVAIDVAVVDIEGRTPLETPTAGAPLLGGNVPGGMVVAAPNVAG